jgi:hypothetical protein
MMLNHERREARRRVLQLLTLSGAIRPADAKPNERLIDELHDEAPCEDAFPLPQDRGCIWTMDLKDVWQSYLKRRNHELPG